MKLNREFLGKEYSVDSQSVEPEGIQKYALATNDENPRYLVSDAEQVPPPIYPVVFLPGILSQLVDDSEKMEFNILRVVHAEHRMQWLDTLRPGDEIHTTARIANMETRDVNEILDLEIQCKRNNDILVQMDYRLLVRGVKKEGEKKAPRRSEEPERGKLLTKQSMMVTADQGKRYAEASGDHNPIHVSDEIARSVGLPSAILHGLCTMAIASQAIVDNLLDGDPTRLKSMSNRFSRPVLLNQTITTEVYDGGVNEDGLQVVHFETRDENGMPVLTLGIADFSD
jgi:acyl dehydratase